MISRTAQLVGLIGWPVAHSLSPRLHRHWMKQHNLNADYIAMEVQPEDISSAIASLPERGFRGCNITIPHKEEALKQVHSVSNLACRIGATNTLVINEGGHIHADNTDAFGFIESVCLRVATIKPYLDHVVMVGAGGAARAVAVALEDAGAKKITIINRTAEKAKLVAEGLKIDCEAALFDRFNDIISDATMLVNTSSLGMEGKDNSFPHIDTLPKQSLVCDIVYAPHMTPLLTQAKARGNVIVPGIGMLAFQAAKSFELWFGIRPHIDEDLLNTMQQWRAEQIK